MRVVIIGQDPYHDDGQAEGLCFSVPTTHKVPSSLNNIYKELVDCIPGFKKPGHGHLSKWCSQGILLLNTGLTVRAHEANSHKDHGTSSFSSDPSHWSPPVIIAYKSATGLPPQGGNNSRMQLSRNFQKITKVALSPLLFKNPPSSSTRLNARKAAYQKIKERYRSPRCPSFHSFF